MIVHGELITACEIGFTILDNYKQVFEPMSYYGES
jgi:hypothetical protein